MALGRLDSASGGRPLAEINVVPLVDVMLVLLVVFIITVPLLTHAVKLQLPQERSQPNVGKNEHVEIAVQRDGRIYWNGEMVARDELEQRAARLSATEPQTEIHLKGDAAVPYGDMARILAILARQGLSRIGFVTDPAKP